MFNMGKFILILMALCVFAAAQNPNGAPTDNPNQRTTNNGSANQGNSNPGNQGTTNQGNPNPGNQGNPNPGNPTPGNQGDPNPGNPTPGNQGNPNPGNPTPDNQGNPNPAAQIPDGAPTPDNPNQRTTNDGNANQGNSNSGNQGNPNPGNATPDNQGNPNPGDPNKPPTDAFPPIDDKKCCGRPLRNMKECCDSPSLVSDEDIDKCVAEMSSNSPDDSPVKMAESKGKTDEGKGDDNKGGKQGRGKQMPGNSHDDSPGKMAESKAKTDEGKGDGNKGGKQGRGKRGGSAEDKDDKSKENGGSSEEGGRNEKMKGHKGMGHMGRDHHMRNGGQHWGDKFGAIGKRFNPRAMSCVFKKKGFFEKDGKVDQKKVTAAFVDKVNKDWKPVVQSALTACFADLEAAGKKNGHSAQNGNKFSASQLVLCVRSKMAKNCPAAAEKKSQTVDCVKSKAELEACDPFHIPPRREFGDMMRHFEELK
ncbi:hypothetical protein B566_EDAN015783, partial [Ephemera danica]